MPNTAIISQIGLASIGTITSPHIQGDIFFSINAPKPTRVLALICDHNSPAEMKRYSLL